MLVGVLALQGAFREHVKMLETCGVDGVEIRRKEELANIDGLIIPGGESTTIGKLMVKWDLLDTIRNRVIAGMPVFGTCAGMVLLAKDIVGSDQPRLNLMDVTAVRNAYGRQVDSFEAELDISAIDGKPFKGVFIRAPYIEKVEPHVGIMSKYGEKIVMARQGNCLSSAFHPELTDDTRVHNYFIKMIDDAIKNK